MIDGEGGEVRIGNEIGARAMAAEQTAEPLAMPLGGWGIPATGLSSHLSA